MRLLVSVAAAVAAMVAMVVIVLSSVPDPAVPAAVAIGSSPTPLAATPSPSSAASATPSRQPVALETLRISLPRLGIDLPLALGDVQRDVRLGATPEHVALLFPTTNVPGTGGNSYIYAHARDDMFLRLWEVKIGDRVRIAAADGTHFDYTVTRILPRVDPADTSWLDATGPERLTLQTSTGPTGSEPRFVVVAERSTGQPGD
jgi:LPXTG-site transpeptidase (sortase) family protein